MKWIFFFLCFGCLLLALATQIATNKPIPALVYAVIGAIAGKAAGWCKISR